MAKAAAAAPELVEDLRAFLAHGLILDPYLAGLMSEHFEEGARQFLDHEAAQLAVRHWREPLVTRTLADVPAPTRLGRTAAQIDSPSYLSSDPLVSGEGRGPIPVVGTVPAHRQALAGRRVDHHVVVAARPGLESMRQRGYWTLVGCLHDH